LKRYATNNFKTRAACFAKSAPVCHRERKKFMEPIASSTKSKTPLIIGVGLLLVVALVGAAFLAGRFLNQPAAPAGPQGLVGPGGAGGPGADGGLQSVEGSGEGELQVTPAPELPKLPPEVTGLFVSREDNRLFIGTGKTTMTAGGSGDVPKSSYDGPQVEVVVTQDTKVYRETTQPPDPAQPSSVLQQTVALGSVDELTSDTTVIVWGRRTGDRVIADVLLYAQPMIIQGPAP
jgi:hypothetical protein